MQPFTDRSLKLPGAHVITDSRKVFGGPLTQTTLLATKQTKEKNPTLFQAVANALEPAIRVANAGKRQAAALWTQVQKAPESIDDLVAQLNDPGFEFTSRPQRIAHFTAFLNRTGTLKAKVGDWKELFWETAHHQQGDEPRPVGRCRSTGGPLQTRAAGSDLPARRLQITTAEPDAPARRWLYGLAGLGG